MKTALLYFIITAFPTRVGDVYVYPCKANTGDEYKCYSSSMKKQGDTVWICPPQCK